MVRAIVHKEDDRVLLEVSNDDPEVEGLKDGDILRLTIGKSPREDISQAEFEALVDRIIDENMEALEYLGR